MSGVAADVDTLLRGLDVSNLAELAKRGLTIRHAITAAPFPAELQEAILSAYRRLGGGEPHARRRDADGYRVGEGRTHR